jgi:hypothetical protein
MFLTSIRDVFVPFERGFEQFRNRFDAGLKTQQDVPMMGKRKPKLGILTPFG